jgi:predicted transcriptional regulator
MPKNRASKPVHSFRLSAEGLRQLQELSRKMERSESNVVEVALDRMYREELRYRCMAVKETDPGYEIEEHKEQK